MDFVFKITHNQNQERASMLIIVSNHEVIVFAVESLRLFPHRYHIHRKYRLSGSDKHPAAANKKKKQTCPPESDKLLSLNPHFQLHSHKNILSQAKVLIHGPALTFYRDFPPLTVNHRLPHVLFSDSELNL